MSNLSPAFAFPLSAEPLVLAAARSLVARLDAGEVITRPILNSILTGHFGGSDADARWAVRDAHAPLDPVCSINESPIIHTIGGAVTLDAVTVAAGSLCSPQK